MNEADYQEYYGDYAMMHTIEVKDLSLADYKFIHGAFVVNVEKLEGQYTNIKVYSDEDLDKLTDYLDDYNLEWRLI